MNIAKIIIVLILLYVGYRVVKMLRGGRTGSVKGHRADAVTSRGEDLVQDPFCKIYVPKSQAMVQEINGHVHYFCSRKCLDQYISEKK